MKNIKIISTFIIISLYIISISINSNENNTQENNISNQEENNSSNQEKNFDEIIFNWSRTFAQTLDIAHKKHYKITDIENSMIKSIDGFASTLDAHSGFLDSKTYKDMLEM